MAGPFRRLTMVRHESRPPGTRQLIGTCISPALRRCRVSGGWESSEQLRKQPRLSLPLTKIEKGVYVVRGTDVSISHDSWDGMWAIERSGVALGRSHTRKDALKVVETLFDAALALAPEVRHPFDLPPGNVHVSLSGGRTSAFLLHKLLERHGDLPERVAVVFANTGREMPEIYCGADDGECAAF